MVQLFNASEYAHIHSLVFRDDYPGYTPNVVESPNGDGSKLDTEKRYAHVAEKYLSFKKYDDKGYTMETAIHHNEEMNQLRSCLDRAHNLALEVAVSIGVPRPFWPSRKYSALRVLEYGPTAVTHTHTDFDLFTLMLYRNLPEYFEYYGPEDTSSKRFEWLNSRSVSQVEKHEDMHFRAKQLNTQVHFGELLEEIDSTVYRADDHRVVASNGPSQYSIVYFAVPEHDAVLPSWITVGEWMQERKSRSRYER